jgi:hypothetical protein
MILAFRLISYLELPCVNDPISSTALYSFLYSLFIGAACLKSFAMTIKLFLATMKVTGMQKRSDTKNPK